MVAFQFPPLSGTSGVERALRFSAYLPDHGWEPIVLTANEGVFEERSADRLSEVREGTKIVRAPALDTKRHFAIGGRYLNRLAIPDRWHWWRLSAIPLGLLAIRRHKPDLIWSTYPIATAHCVGRRLSRLSGIPLVADFRDPMAQDDYPSDPATWRSFDRIERQTVNTAAISTFTTPGAIDTYRLRYPYDGDKFRLLENGYDESAFTRIESDSESLNPGKLTLLHSGMVYSSERDPTCLFEALSLLRDSSPDEFARLVVRFRSPGEVELLRSLATKFGVADSLQIGEQVSHREAAAEMMRADGLMILQASNCNQQIPAKLYEYYFARRPILLLTDEAGDTAWSARSAGIEAIADLADANAIANLLGRFVRGEVNALPTDEAVEGASRRKRTAELAALFDELYEN